MIRRIFSIFISCIFLLFCDPVYSKDLSQKSLDRYINKVSDKFSRTYCNTTQFGISHEGALAFAIGETNKEFKNQHLNYLIDYSLLKEKAVKKIESNCQVFDFSIDNLENLKLEE